MSPQGSCCPNVNVDIKNIMWVTHPRVACVAQDTDSARKPTSGGLGTVYASEYRLYRPSERDQPAIVKGIHLWCYFCAYSEKKALPERKIQCDYCNQTIARNKCVHLMVSSKWSFSIGANSQFIFQKV
jgi:hypothetical protein